MLFWLVPGGFSYHINYIEQLESKLEKNIGIYKHAGKVRKAYFLSIISFFLFKCKIIWIKIRPQFCKAKKKSFLKVKKF